MKDIIEEFREFTICKPWELDKDLFYVDATPECLEEWLTQALTRQREQMIEMVDGLSRKIYENPELISK